MPDKPEDLPRGHEESGQHGSSAQVISHVTAPPMINTSNQDGFADFCKPQYNMTTAGPTVPMARLEKSQLVATGAQDGPTDDVLLEKQAAKAAEYQPRDPRLHVDHYSSGLSDSSQGHAGLVNMSDSSSVSSDVSMLSLGSSRHSGPEPTSATHSSGRSDSRGYREAYINIPPEEYPARFKEQQYDCVLIYSSVGCDQNMAVNFKDIITNHVRLEDGRPPEVCILDRNDNLTYIQSRFKHAEEAMERSTYMFLFITRDFVEDGWAEMQKDECLMNSIDEPDRKWCVVPLHTKSKKELNFRYPYGLRALKGVDISVMLKDLKLDEVDPKIVSRDDLDPFFLQNISRMFNQRLDHKLKRERQQQLELERWIQKEKIHRLQVAIKEEQRKVEEKAKHDREVTLLREEAERNLERIQLGKPVERDESTTEQIKQPLQSKLQETLVMLQSMGMSLPEAVAMLHSSQSGQIAGLPPGAPGSGVTYNIYNHGTMQVGSSNTQNVRDTPGTETEPEDETEYTVMDAPDVTTDDPISTVTRPEQEQWTHPNPLNPNPGAVQDTTRGRGDIVSGGATSRGPVQETLFDEAKERIAENVNDEAREIGDGASITDIKAAAQINEVTESVAGHQTMSGFESYRSLCFVSDSSLDVDNTESKEH